MPKTKLTKNVERFLWDQYVKNKMGVFGCYEVTIGDRDTWHGGGYDRVDFMTYDSKGEFRCYEIKVSKSDFNSAAKKSFYGDFNYYVMPLALYEELGGKEFFDQWQYKDVGVLLYSQEYPCVKQPKRRSVAFNVRADLMESMLRSMFREENSYIRLARTGNRLTK